MVTETIGLNSTDDYNGADASIEVTLKKIAATTNQNGAGTVEVHKYSVTNHAHTVIAFPGLSNIPSGATVTGATLYLYCVTATAASGSQTATLKKLNRDWGEATATWNTYDGTNGWTTVGALHETDDRDSTTTASFTMPETTGVYHSVTSAQLITDVQNWVDGTDPTNYGWHIERTDGSNDSTQRAYDDGEGTDGQRPYLEVVYTAASDTIDSIDDPVLDGETGNALTYSGFASGTPDSLTIRTAGSEFSLDISSSLSAGGGSATFDMPDIAAITSSAGTSGIPLDTASWTPLTAVLSNGTESATTTFTFDEKTNWHPIELASPVTTIGSLFYVAGGWKFAAPANTDQVYYYSTEIVDDQAADYFKIGATGVMEFNLTTGSVPVLFLDVTDGKWYYDTVQVGGSGGPGAGSGFISGVGRLGRR